MAFPTVSAITTSELTTDGQTFTPALGAPTAGELILVVVGFDGIPATIDLDFAASGAWFSTLTATSNGTVTARAFWKIAAGSDVLTVNISDGSEQAVAVAYRITGHGSTVTFATPVAGNSTNADCPSVTESGGAQDTLFIAAAVMDAQVVATVAPAGYASLTTKAHTNAAGASVSTARKTATAVTDNPGTMTSATEQWIGFTFAVASTAITTKLRLTQDAIETLADAVPRLRATQIAVEALTTATVYLRLTQLSVEALSSATVYLRLTQLAVETLSQSTGHLRLTQIAVETLSESTGHLRLTQLAVESLSKEDVHANAMIGFIT